MKKLFLIIFMLFTFIIGLNVNVFASVGNDYFQELTENYSQNPKSSCTFVATTMLLSYYDTYLNDDIIPEQYDAVSDRLGSSPGVFRESVESKKSSEFVPELIAMKEKSLQGLLMYIAGLFDYELGSINNQQREQVLIYYFNNYTDFDYGVDYTFTHLSVSIDPKSTQSQVEEFVEDKINAGEPVIYCYDFGTNKSIDPSTDPERSGHAAIAHSYSNNDIYVHLGDDKDMYGNNMNNYSNYNLSNKDYYAYTIATGAFSINFNIEHKHSNNYVIDDDDYYHLLQCPCGYYTYETHNTIVTETGAPRCKDCNKAFSLNESFNIMLDPSNDSLCGTHVSIYGGSLNSTDIVVGYTRVAYVIGGSEVSRLDYNWHSSNTDICEVTKYGTILAKDVGTAYIIASSKDEPFKFDIILVTVLEDTTAGTKYISMTTDIRTPNELNGTEVRLNNGNANEFSVHSGFTRALCFSLNNAYPSIDDFTWQSSNSCLQLLPGGYVKANEVEEETIVYVFGYSKYNTNIMAVMTFTVIPYEEGE